MGEIIGNSSIVTRRDFLAKVGVSVAGITVTGSAIGMNGIMKDINPDYVRSSLKELHSSLEKGQVFNESEEFADLMTGRKTRRLTRSRQFNQQPAYHLNACFSADSRYMVLSTIMEDGSSALLKAEVATGDLTVVATLDKDSGEKFTDKCCMIQAANMMAANTGKRLRVYDLDTLEERILLTSLTGLWHPTGSIDGKKIFFPQYGQPVLINGVEVKPATHLQVDIASGETRELFRETGAQCNHVVPCPTDPDLLLVDRDFPPKFSAGSDDGKTSRVWILNIKTKKLTEIRPKDENRFQIHSNWSYKGEYLYYHGYHFKHDYWLNPNRGHYIGVADKKGKTIWESFFPTFFYGHVSSHTRGNIIITDALFTKNLITAVYFEELNSRNIPRIEILAQHDSNWDSGQNSHPHPHLSPDGKWMSYNRGVTQDSKSRSDVYVVRL